MWRCRALTRLSRFRVGEFLSEAREWGSAYGTNNIIMTMGSDFNYQGGNSIGLKDRENSWTKFRGKTLTNFQAIFGVGSKVLGGAATCYKGFVVSFLKAPLASLGCMAAAV